MNDNPPEEACEPIASEEFDDDTVAELWDEWNKEAQRLGKLARGAYLELQTRMRERKASKLNTPHWTGTMKPGAIHHTVTDPVTLRQRLVALVGDDDIRAAFIQPPAPPMRENNQTLNELVKRGGLIAQIIAEERRSVRGEDVLVLERKKGV